MLENLRKKMFRLFSWISLKYRLFITYLLLSSLILLLTSVFFYSASKKVLIKCATLSSQQQLSLITNNLGDKINHISDYAITLSINSNIANVLKENQCYLWKKSDCQFLQVSYILSGRFLRKMRNPHKYLSKKMRKVSVFFH